MILGIGVSGPQIVEGWYGQPWGRPNAAPARLRDDRAQGPRPRRPCQPTTGPRSRSPTAVRAPSGQGKALKSIMHPRRAHPDLARVRRTDEHRAVPPSCATAGCRWAFGPTASTTTASRWPRLRPADRRPRRDDFEVFTGCQVVDHRRRGRGARRHASAHRDVRRWDGKRDAQLPPRGDGPARASPRPRRGSRSCGASGQQGRGRSPRSPTSTSSRRRSSDPPARIRATLGGGLRRPPGRDRSHRRRRTARGPRAARRPRRYARPVGRTEKAGSVAYELILVDTPAEHVRRITLNRPEKRNAISTPLRTELLDALRAHDNDPDVRVTIVRGAGPCFSSGYDLAGGPLMEDAPVLLRARRRPVGPAGERHLVQRLGPGEAGDRADPRLRDRRRRPSSRPRATSCTSPRTRRSATRSCGS